jgi:hypothetical protein
LFSVLSPAAAGALLFILGAVEPSLASASHEPAATADPEDRWKQELQKHGVRVWSRHVEGTRIHQLRATTTMDLPAEQVFAFLCDLEAYTSVIPHMTESRKLWGDGDSALYYMVVDPPLVAPRDLCMQVSRARHADGTLVAAWTTGGEGCPAPTKGRVRIERNEGRWRLTPLEGGRTEVDYVALTDPAGSVPKWLVNRGAPGGVVEVLEGVRKAAALPKYAR